MIIDEGDGKYTVGEVDIIAGRHHVQLHVDRYAEFNYQQLKELGQFLLELEPPVL